MSGDEVAITRQLSESERRQLLTRHPLWQLVAGRDAIQRCFRFGDFPETFGFISAVAIAAERIDHHPEWSNVYDRVEILLTTHDVAGLSERDDRLADWIDELAVLFGAASG